MIVDENMKDSIRVTVIATGLNRDHDAQEPHTVKAKPAPTPPVYTENIQSEIIPPEANTAPKTNPGNKLTEKPHQEDLFKNLSENDMSDMDTPAWIRKQHYAQNE